MCYKVVSGAQEGSREGTRGLNKLCFSSGGQNRPAAGVYMSHRAFKQLTILGLVNLIEDILLCFIFIGTNKCTINITKVYITTVALYIIYTLTCFDIFMSSS
jgi:hypothetical protein